MAGSSHDLAFACSWWRPRVSTWSFTSTSLRDAFLGIGVRLTDIEAQPQLILQAGIAATLTLLGQRPWKYAGFYRRVEARRVQAAVARKRPHAVLELADIVVPTVMPTFCYQDMNYSVAVENYPILGSGLVSTIPTSLSKLRRLADEQHASLAKIDGIFAMGKWYKTYLVEKMGLAPERVYAAGAGLPDFYQRFPQRQVRPRSERCKLIFVGTDFIRKGGDNVLEAVRLLNKSGDRRLSLTIVGPSAWPFDFPPPDWVNFRGLLPRVATAELIQSHDLFVMPSRFEAYGKAFLEARALGVPCIGRDAYSMPELIEPGQGGAVWKGNKVAELADLIASTLDDDELHEQCARMAHDLAVRNSWEQVARRMLEVIQVHTAS